MKIENLQLNIEVLVPGILQIVVMCHIFSDKAKAILTSAIITQDQFLTTSIYLITFLAAAYAAGVFCTIIARFLMDWPADLFFTPFLLRIFEPGDFKGLCPIGRGRGIILKRYRRARNIEVKGHADAPGLTIIVKYRQATQILRACMIPAAFYVWELLNGKDMMLAFELVAVTIYLPSLFVFAYCEVALYQQCRKIDGKNR